MTEYEFGDYDEEATSKEAVSKLLVGRTVVKVSEDTLELDNGVQLYVEGNEGCGGCSEGHYNLDALNEVANAIMSVEFSETEEEGRWGFDQDVFRIFVYTEFEKATLLEVSGHDNGYYGRGYSINVRTKEERGE